MQPWRENPSFLYKDFFLNMTYWLPCFHLWCLAEVFELKKRLFLLIEVSGPATEARRSYSNRFARKSQTLVKKDPSSLLLDLRHFTINSRASGLQRKAAYDAVADSVNTYSCSSEGGACCWETEKIPELYFPPRLPFFSSASSLWECTVR